MDIEARTECQMGILSDYGIVAFERPATSGIRIQRCNLWFLAKSMISSTAALEISSADGVN
jgi:hypothetical protein